MLLARIMYFPPKIEHKLIILNIVFPIEKNLICLCEYRLTGIKEGVNRWQLVYNLVTSWMSHCDMTMGRSLLSN